MIKANYVSAKNSTATALSGGGTFVGVWEEVYLYDSVVVSMKSDQSGTLYVEFSPDGQNTDSTLTYSYVTGEVEPPHRLTVTRRYCRVRYTNGSSAQTYLRLQMLVGSFPQLSSPLNSSIAQDADALVVRTVDAGILMAGGYFSGFSIVNKYGRNPDIDSGTLPEDIWEAGGVYTGWATAAETVQVVSSSASDAAAGTGARTIRIMGLDANYVVQQETITLNGTSNVNSTNTFIRVHTASILSAGSGGVNAGTITVRQTTTAANVFMIMQIGVNQTNSSAYTVPAGKTAYMRSIHAAVRGGASNVVDGYIWTRAFGQVFRARRPFTVSTASGFRDDIFGGLVFTEKADIILRISATAGNSLDVVGGYDLIIVDN